MLAVFNPKRSQICANLSFPLTGPFSLSFDEGGNSTSPFNFLRFLDCSSKLPVARFGAIGVAPSIASVSSICCGHFTAMTRSTFLSKQTKIRVLSSRLSIHDSKLFQSLVVNVANTDCHLNPNLCPQKLGLVFISPAWCY